jgi:hypothetical protein
MVHKKEGVQVIPMLDLNHSFASDFILSQFSRIHDDLPYRERRQKHNLA